MSNKSILRTITVLQLCNLLLLLKSSNGFVIPKESTVRGSTHSSASTITVLLMKDDFLTNLQGSVNNDENANVNWNAANVYHQQSKMKKGKFKRFSGNLEEEHEGYADNGIVQSTTNTKTGRKQFLHTFATAMAVIVVGALGPYQYPAHATYIDPKTKINLPSPGEIEQAIPTDWTQVDNPFSSNTNPNDYTSNGVNGVNGVNSVGSSSANFSRLNNSNDAIFYKDPRFVEHVDDSAVQTMQRYIQSEVLSKNYNSNTNMNTNVLDLCSSWTSHIDIPTKNKLQIQRIAGLGMNEQELKANPVLDDYTILDLNNSPNVKLPYDDSTFDVVLCQLSIDYLIYPLQVLKEIGRVLKSNGQVVILFSNRLFLEKAVGIWTGADDIDHAYFVSSYIYFSNGGFQTTSIQAKDLSTRNKKGMVVGDPMYVVTARKE